MKNKFLGFYDYTVVLTYLGLIFGCRGLLYVMDNSFAHAAFCLMIAGVCDMFDGTVARTKENRTDAEKKFGIQIDSLCDLICFGVLPALFLYEMAGKRPAAGLVSILYILCALIRLAFFNVMEEERQKETDECRTSYVGIPVTTIAVLLPLEFLLYDNGVFENPFWFAALLVMMGLGFISTIPVKKPNLIGKIVLIVLGIIEAIGVLFFIGWGAV